MSAAPPADRIVELGHVVEAAAAFRAAGRLGVVEQLGREPATADEVALRCGTAPGATALLLEALEALGVLRRDDDRYAVTAMTRWLGTLEAGWARLDEVVRTGRPVVAADTPAGAAELYPDVVPFLTRLFAPAIRQAAERLAPVDGDVLDVGAGAAPWSLALAAADPTARITALDLPEVLPVTRRAVSQAGLDDRFRLQPGDVFTADLPEGGYDLVLLANVCHLFDADTNRALLRRLRRVLRPGGTLAVVDALPSGDPDERRLLALYALGLRLRTAAGAVYPLESYSAWAAEAGLGPVSAVPLSRTPPLALLTCTVPAGADAVSRGTARRPGGRVPGPAR